MRHLSSLTNIIPVIGKSDSLSHTQTLTLKLSLLRDLKANNIPIFTFGKTISELERNVVNEIPWAVSCLRDDAAEMDASLLMNDENAGTCYLDSDLPHLVSMIMSNSSWLRFSSTKKFIDWRNTSSNALIPLSSSNESMSIISLPENYAMARMGDHISSEERITKIRMTQWSGEMQRQIKTQMISERDEFFALENNQRIKWLISKLNEAISEQQNSPKLLRTHKKRRMRMVQKDPLGLVWVGEKWGRTVSKGIVWIVEAGVVVGGGWVVWKYVVDSGLTGWFLQSARS
jgi:septin family protein